ncbi:MAG: DTW domain-containing protein [Myxococcota bacterium]
MRSTTPKDLSGHCQRCLLRLEICICEVVPRVSTRLSVLIVQHVAELRLTSNTGRLAALALPNAKILEYGGGEPFDESALSHDDSVLLYSASVVSPSCASPLPERISRLVVLDGSFRQARRMYKRIRALRSLPELALPPPPTPPLRLRQPPHAAGMSTLEAIAHALALIEGEELARPLHALQAEFVQRVDALRGRRRDEQGRGIS